jgi:hypothetical protein
MITGELSFAQYAALPAISNTALGKLSRSPAHYKAWLDSREEDESEALRIGRIAHRAILEPKEFEAEFATLYAVKPDGMKFSTREGKDWKLAREGEGRSIITFEQAEFLSASAKSISTHKTAGKMLKAGRAELSVTAELDGIPVKCRVDFATEGNALVDLKTARDASKRGFQRAIVDRGYHRQAAFYLDVCKAAGLEKKHFTFLAVEKEPPFLLGCYRLDEQAIHQGRTEYRRLLELYAKCKAEDSWPGYPDTLEEIGLPQWAVKETQDPEWMKDEAA